jgi:hypothetical protein
MLNAQSQKRKAIFYALSIQLLALSKFIKESEMLRTITYQDLPSWEIGFEQGIEQVSKKRDK